MAFGLEGSVPFPDPDLNIEIRADQILKLLRIGVGKMVGIDDLGSKATDDTRRFVDRHRKRQIHTNKGDVDILQRTHFGNILRVTRTINASSTQRDDVSISCPLGMIRGRQIFADEL